MKSVLRSTPSGVSPKEKKKEKKEIEKHPKCEWIQSNQIHTLLSSRKITNF